jgi:hypothetical protein
MGAFCFRQIGKTTVFAGQLRAVNSASLQHHYCKCHITLV